MGFHPALVASVAGLVLAAGACSPAPKQAEWGSGHGPGFCEAGTQAGDPVFVRLSRQGGESGLSVFADAFGDRTVDGIYPDATLELNGEPVRAQAFGVTLQGRHGIFFSFNPRPLLRRNPDGFALAVKRGGRPVFAAKLSGAAKAFGELRACDVKLLVGETAG